MKKVFLLLIACLLVGGVQAADKADVYNQTLKAIQQGNLAQADRLQRQLGSDFPLVPYLQYARVNRQLPQVAPKDIQAFRSIYKETPLAAAVYAQALASYARANRWSSFMSLVDGRPNSLTYRCYYAEALYRTGEKSRSLQEARSVVAEQAALPASCRSFLLTLAKQGQLTTGELSTLAYSAFKQEQGNWLDTVINQLPKDNLVRRWLPTLYAKPGKVASVPAGAERAKLLELGLWKLARQDSEEALAVWKRVPGDQFSSPVVNRQIGSRIAWYSAISSEQPNRDWVERWLKTHAGSMPDTLEQRTRHAVEEQDWKGVLQWTALMSPANRNSSYWLYWQGRAHTALGDSAKGIAAWQQAAKERNFYGFLAADKLGLDYAMHDDGAGEGQPQLTSAQQTILTRVRWLHEAGQHTDASREWYFLLARVNRDNQLALGRYAAAKGWFNFAVTATIQGNLWDNLPLRFPLAFRADLEPLAEQVIPGNSYLAMAIARRESSFSPVAMSHVGARGLMQLMPGTANQVAKRLGKTVSTSDLFDVKTNLELGTHYLGELLEQYGGNRVLSLAAYNAGPSRVDRWIAGSEKPYDVWIESIPFRETRNYVQAVLTYRVILMRQAGIASKDIAMLSNDEQRFVYTRRAVELAKSSATE